MKFTQSLFNSIVEAEQSESLHSGTCAPDCLGCQVFKWISENRQLEIYQQKLACEILLNPLCDPFSVLRLSLALGFILGVRASETLQLEESFRQKEN